MTPVLRAAMDIAPFFLITAPEPRTGKTLLVYLCAVLATGHNPVATAGSEKSEEMEKRIETAALSGRPILHFNNLPNGMMLESASLSQMITEGEVRIRKLGVHQEGLCDCRATTVFANGNNVTVSEDLVPRTVASASMQGPNIQKNGPLNSTRLSGCGRSAALTSRRCLPSPKPSWRRTALSPQT